MAGIYNPIGSTFKEGNTTLKVVVISDYRTCTGCYYTNKAHYRGSCYTHRHACTSSSRKDKKQVIFVPVNS